MATPLYKSLKPNGTSFYAFPGAAEDIAATRQNDNVTMTFDKFICLDIPKQNINSNPVKLDFDSTFFDNQPDGSIPEKLSGQLIESLRNYVANQEVCIKNSRMNSTEYYYDNTVLSTTTEKIFWKWCHKLGILDLELAIPNDEYFANLQEFESNDVTDDEYFPEYLWKEREVTEWDILQISQGQSYGSYTQPLEIQFDGQTNIKVGDYVKLDNFKDSNLEYLNGDIFEVVYSQEPTFEEGQIIKLGTTYVGETIVDDGMINVVYDRLIKYIGEITSVNNVKNANKSYTEVIAYIGDHQGETPDVLFRTSYDDNYKPNQKFPILPSQYQPEIIGAESFTSPIRSNPENYPGDYWAQFDDPNYLYETSSGDTLRRSGDYYGVDGDINAPVFDSSNIDGIGVDFDTNHYAKMNIINKEVSNFDEFNAMDVNNEPPKDFEFNAILWYYTVRDSSGNTATNLYGIEFLDNPQNNPNPNLVDLKLPDYKKLVNNGNQDGTSYSLSLNLNYYISNDQIQPSFDPNNINSLFSFELYNEAMRRLASANDNFDKSLAEHDKLKAELNNIKQLLYTQTQLTTINNRIDSMAKLLKLYSTLQLSSTDSIEVVRDNSVSPPVIELNNKDSRFTTMTSVSATDMYSVDTGIIPYNLNVPNNKDFFVRVLNNDTIDATFQNPNDRLTMVIDRDLDYKQTLEFVIDGTDDCTKNKKLDIWINYSDGTPNQLPVLTPLISDLDLPIYYNESNQLSNPARSWEQTTINIDLSNDITILDDDTIGLKLDNTIGLSEGDYVNLNNLQIGATTSNNYSGQYLIESINATSSIIELDITSNISFTDFAKSKVYPYVIHSTASSTLTALPFINFNKGYKFSITRISQDISSAVEDRYIIIKSEVN